MRGARRRQRNAAAPRIASSELVAKNPTMSSGGQPVPACTAKCADNAAARHHAHRRGGVSISASVRMVLGGHITDVVAGGIRRR